ncbi:hypothetical protein [Xanthocytophaga agilis]|uniref:Transglutaminase-like domain-containing protein n=1 Tax=Xanthocytophaga agilis TaxID=3048010 RepID=A0AAE3RB46_9BACT|nr:hypothetical protein [Xanthocytophaga agilis]MDJ1506600.1 hypothetical protein [Xanthocytophaga agilis]
MRQVIYIWILILSGIAMDGAQGQTIRWHSSFEEKVFTQWTDSSSKELAAFFAADPVITDSLFFHKETELTSLCNQLAKKRKKFLAESQFLYYVFKQVHNRYMYHYQPYPLFTSLQDSVYNCVSGTALYAWVLGKLGFVTEVREMNRHVYLRVHTVRSTYLIDATDLDNGFVSDDEVLISRRELWYASNEIAQARPCNKIITLSNLAGLQYFNEAVKAFNRGTYEKCMQILNKANILYPDSEKIANLQIMAQKQLPSAVARIR